MPHRFLALGDSYTIGEGVAPHERWPSQLAALLRANGVSLAEPEIVARTGWTTDELAEGIALAAPVGPFDLVTLLIGVNNQYRGRPTDEYREHFRDLLSGAVCLAAGESRRVLVVSIPDWGVTSFAADRDAMAIANAIDEFNAINRQETESAGAWYGDITPISRERSAGWEAADGLHPSAAQYTAWARHLESVAAGILKASPRSGR